MIKLSRIATAGDKIPEPESHLLPLTRQWVKDYRQYGTGPKPGATGEQSRIIPFAKNGAPDLQALIERADRRHAVSIGEQYIEDPHKRPPHYGGYAHITSQEWTEYDQVVAEWQARRREVK